MLYNDKPVRPFIFCLTDLPQITTLSTIKRVVYSGGYLLKVVYGRSASRV